MYNGNNGNRKIIKSIEKEEISIIYNDYKFHAKNSPI